MCRLHNGFDMKVLAMQSPKKAKIENGRQTVRLKFQKARQFLNPVNAIIQIGFARGKNKGTAIGRAMSYTLHSAMEGLFPDINVNASQARLSAGVISGLRVTDISRFGKSISLSWDPQVSRVACTEDDDRVLLCAYAVEQELAAVNEEQVWRKAGKLQLELPAGMEQLGVHLYLIVHDRSKQNCSNSQYLGWYN
ncbi:hypothetical protein EDF66_103129 [Sphingobacterium sp. JUb20]|nr:hypothetical protein EDF66_103129 [Sphingobacterium sp. JUb20]